MWLLDYLAVNYDCSKCCSRQKSNPVVDYVLFKWPCCKILCQHSILLLFYFFIHTIYRLTVNDLFIYLFIYLILDWFYFFPCSRLITMNLKFYLSLCDDRGCKKPSSSVATMWYLNNNWHLWCFNVWHIHEI